MGTDTVNVVDRAELIRPLYRDLLEDACQIAWRKNTLSGVLHTLYLCHCHNYGTTSES